MLPTTLQIAMLAAPCRLASRKRRERVGGFARLRDDDRQRVRRDDRIAVAELGSVVDLDRHARELLDHVLADQAGVPRRAAGEDRDALDRARSCASVIFISSRNTGRCPATRGRGSSRAPRRLLEDLLEHEMLEAGLFRHDRIPQHALRRLGDRPAEEVGERARRSGDDRHLVVAEEDDVARVAEDGGNVGRDEELAVAEPDDDRRTLADGDDLLGLVGRDEHQREEAAHQQQRAPHGVLEAVVFHLALDQVRDDLGVGLGDEVVALRAAAPA